MKNRVSHILRLMAQQQNMRNEKKLSLLHEATVK